MYAAVPLQMLAEYVNCSSGSITDRQICIMNGNRVCTNISSAHFEYLLHGYATETLVRDSYGTNQALSNIKPVEKGIAGQACIAIGMGLRTTHDIRCNHVEVLIRTNCSSIVAGKHVELTPVRILNSSETTFDP